MKLCTKCRELKDESDFSKNKTVKDGLNCICKACMKEYRVINKNKIRENDKEYYQLKKNNLLEYSKEYQNIIRKDKQKHKQNEQENKRTHGPMSKNRDCPNYLGIHIAEKLVAKYFKNPFRMPWSNPGYDFICSNGFKIDVKSAILTTSKNRWLFLINKNKIADYFLCLAYDNRNDLNLLHVWLFPGPDINNKRILSSIPSTISKWFQYEKPIGDMKGCCDTLKEATM